MLVLAHAGCPLLPCLLPANAAVSACPPAADPRACIGVECNYTPDPSTCSFQWSDGGQAGFCDIPNPSTWPALMQVPRTSLQEPTVALYTGARWFAGRGSAWRYPPRPVSFSYTRILPAAGR